MRATQSSITSSLSLRAILRIGVSALGMQRRPLDPIVVCRSVLVAQRMAGRDFDTAWEVARAQALGCAERQSVVEADAVARALGATRGVWQSAYDHAAVDQPYLNHLRNIA